MMRGRGEVDNGWESRGTYACYIQISGQLARTWQAYGHRQTTPRLWSTDKTNVQRTELDAGSTPVMDLLQEAAHDCQHSPDLRLVLSARLREWDPLHKWNPVQGVAHIIHHRCTRCIEQMSHKGVSAMADLHGCSVAFLTPTF